MYPCSQDGQSQTEKFADKVLMINQNECSAHSSFDSASSFSSFRSHSSHSPGRYNYSKERARMNFKCQGSFTHSCDGSKAPSTSPAPSHTSGYISNCSDQVLGTSQSTESKVMETNNSRPCKRPVLVRHPSLPDQDDDWEETFSESVDFSYSDFDESSIASGFVNLELDNPKIHFTADQLPTNNLSGKVYDHIQCKYIQSQTTASGPKQNIPKPIELSSAATRRYLRIYDHVLLPTVETRHSQISLDDHTAGCCPLTDTKKHKEIEVKDQVPSSYVKSFLSWMSSKAGKGTSVIMDVLPTRSKEDFHVVMIGLDGAGKTTALYRMKLDQYLNTVPTIGFNCERVKGTVGRSAGLTFLIWDVGGQEKIRPLWRSYTRSTDGIIFVLDAADYRMLDEARMELHRTLNYHDNINIPVLILANKQDLPMALKEKEIIETLELKKLKNSFWSVELTCSITGEGLDTGIEMMHMMIMKRKMRGKRSRNKTK